MKRNKRQRQSTRRAIALVAALALAAALGQAAAGPLQNVSDDEAERIVRRAFARLDRHMEIAGCVDAGMVEKLDQLFRELYDWDARSQLHQYPVCDSSGSGQ
jgi:hypothetical protein